MNYVVGETRLYMDCIRIRTEGPERRSRYALLDAVSRGQSVTIEMNAHTMRQLRSILRSAQKQVIG